MNSMFFLFSKPLHSRNDVLNAILYNGLAGAVRTDGDYQEEYIALNRKNKNPLSLGSRILFSGYPGSTFKSRLE